MRFCVFLICVLLLTGCQYERSFMNIDSNSGIPFLGLQLSVDAREFSEPLVPHGARNSTLSSQDFVVLAQSPDVNDASAD